MVNIDTVSYQVQFVYEHMVQQGKEAHGDRVYTAILPVANAYRNFNFLLVLDNINKVRNSKYKDAPVEEVSLYEATS